MDFDKYVVQIKELLSSSVIEHKISAVAAIRTIDFSDKTEVAKELFVMIKMVLDVDDNNQFCSSSLTTLLNLYSLNLDIQNEILQEISNILQSTDELILHNAVHSYLRVRQSANLELRSLFFQSFTNIKPQNKRTIDILDSVLYETLSNSFYIEGIEFIEKYLLKNQSFNITDFDSALHLILKKNRID